MKNQEKVKADQGRDTGMALCLLTLLAIYFGKYYQFIPATIFLLVLSMTWPKLFHPLSKWWLRLSLNLSSIMSKVILILLFFGIVTPVGLMRRLTGADPMQLKKWRNGNGSLFLKRDKPIESKDLVQPY